MRRNWFISSLVLILGVVVVLRAFASILNPFFSFAQSESSICGAGRIDMLDYMGQNSEKYNVKYCSPKVGSGVQELFTERKVIDTLDGPKEGFIINKGNTQETYYYDDQWVYLYQDTSWDRTCNDGSAAFYRVRDVSGQWGGRIPRCATPGGSYTSNQEIVAFNKETGEQCDSQYATRPGESVAVTIQISRADDHEYGPKGFKDNAGTVLIENTAGIGAGDLKFYSQGYGLTGFHVEQEGADADNFDATYDSGSGSRELKCSATDRGLPPAGDYYKRFVYPFFSNDAAVMKQTLASSYSVTCSNPASYNTAIEGDIREMIERQGENCDDEACLFEPSADLTVSSEGRDRMFGVLRYEDEAKWRAYDYDKAGDGLKRSFTNRFESIEQWFGANNPAKDSETNPEGAEYLNRTPAEINTLHQGPFYKLSSPNLQCMASIQVLERSVELCAEYKQLTGKTECSLEQKDVPGLGQSIGSLYGEVQGAMGAVGGDEKQFCEVALQPIDGESDQWATLAKKLNYVDLYMETAYRPAFLVMVTDIDENGTNSNDRGQSITATQDGDGPGPGQMVDYLVYHVPDTLTDTDNNYLMKNQDIVTRTTTLFTDPVMTEKYLKTEWDEERNQLKGAVGSGATPGGDLTINCKGVNCDKSLQRALTDYINASMVVDPSLSCQSDPTENAELGTQIGSQLEPQNVEDGMENAKDGDPISEAEIGIEVGEYVGEGGVKEPRDPKPKTRMYNVAPFGGRTEYVADAFDALFSIGHVEETYDNTSTYYSSFEALFGKTLASSPDIGTYTVPVEKIDEDGNRFIDNEEREVSDQIQLGDGSGTVTARFPFLAKIFNNSTRAVVQQISSSGQALLECARNVGDPKRNTEEFLLKCQSYGTSIAGQGNLNNNLPPATPPNNNPSGEFDEFTIQYWNQGYLCFRPPDVDIWNAAKAAAARHGCDPLLLIALAHSESAGFTNEIKNNPQTAGGLWQFTDDTWEEAWMTGSFQDQGRLNKVISGLFDCTFYNSESCRKHNLHANADAACRLALAVGMQKPGPSGNVAEFIKTFSYVDVGENRNPYDGGTTYDRVWNTCPEQGEYAWRLWQALKDPTSLETYDDIILPQANCGHAVLPAVKKDACAPPTE